MYLPSNDFTTEVTESTEKMRENLLGKRFSSQLLFFFAGTTRAYKAIITPSGMPEKKTPYSRVLSVSGSYTSRPKD